MKRAVVVLVLVLIGSTGYLWFKEQSDVDQNYQKLASMCGAIYRDAPLADKDASKKLVDCRKRAEEVAMQGHRDVNMFFFGWLGYKG